MEEVSQGIIPPIIADVLVLLSLALNFVLMIAVAYLFATKSQDGKFNQLDKNIKKVAKDLKNLETKVSEIKPHKVVDTVPQAVPFGIDTSKPRVEENSDPSSKWASFVENYNYIAASMAVPGQRQACEKFVNDNGLKMLMYGGMMTFLPAFDVEESSFWAFKISDTDYAVVPNPMKPCNDEVYNRGGIKETFAINFLDGVYKKYIVSVPAIFTLSSANQWLVKEPGVAKLERV